MTASVVVLIELARCTEIKFFVSTVFVKIRVGVEIVFFRPLKFFSEVLYKFFFAFAFAVPLKISVLTELVDDFTALDFNFRQSISKINVVDKKPFESASVRNGNHNVVNVVNADSFAESVGFHLPRLNGQENIVAVKHRNGKNAF